MRYEVRLSPLAIDDLAALHRWISDQADTMVADAYLSRVETRCAGLSKFPERGSSRADLGEGVRSLSFERRLIIFYRHEDRVVRILRILHGARELGSEFEGLPSSDGGG